MTGEELLMDLRLEQGPGRDTQVQPPAGAWYSYFGLDTEQLPTLRLVDRKQENAQPEDRPVVAGIHGQGIVAGRSHLLWFVMAAVCHWHSPLVLSQVCLL